MKTSIKALAMLTMLAGNLGFRSVSEIRTGSTVGVEKLLEKNRAGMVEGVIESLSVSRSALTINGMAVYLSARTVITAGDKSIQFESLKPGMKVRAFGTVTPPSMSASRLEVMTK